MCSSASRLILALADPPSASGSSVDRRAAMAANSAPTKNAFPSNSTNDTHNAAAWLIRGHRLTRRPGRARVLAKPHTSHPAPCHPDHLERPSRHRHNVSDHGHPPERRHDEPSSRLVCRPVRQRGPQPVAHLVRTPQSRNRPRAVGQRPLARVRSCSSLTSPTISSTTSSRVTTPRCSPYSSTTTASCSPASRGCCSSGARRMVSGTKACRTMSADTGTCGRRSCGTATARLMWTTPSTSSQSRPGHGEPGVARSSGQRTRSSADALRSMPVQRTRGVITSAAVRSAKSSDRVSIWAVVASRVPTCAERRTRLASSSGVRAPDSLLRGDPDGSKEGVGRPVQHSDERAGEDREDAHRHGHDLGGTQRGGQAKKLRNHSPNTMENTVTSSSAVAVATGSAAWAARRVPAVR